MRVFRLSRWDILYCKSTGCNVACSQYTEISSTTSLSIFMQFTGHEQHFQRSYTQKMQLTGWDNANDMRNATCAAIQLHLSGPTVRSPYCSQDMLTLAVTSIT